MIKHDDEITDSTNDLSTTPLTLIEPTQALPNNSIDFTSYLYPDKPEADTNPPVTTNIMTDTPTDTIPTPKGRKTKVGITNIFNEPRQSSQMKTQATAYVPCMMGKSYGYSNAQLAETQYHAKIMEMVMTQLTLKAAIKMWGNDARIAAEYEMKRLHWKNSFKPVSWNELTDTQKSQVLESHIFMKKNLTCEIKGRTVAGGNKQQGYIKKEFKFVHHGNPISDSYISY